MRSLTVFEREIVAHIPLRAEHSQVEVARSLRTKSHKVAYAMQRLVAEDMLYPLLAVDVSKLGWSRFTAFIGIEFASSKERGDFIATAKKNSRVAFFAEVSGDFDFELSIVAKSIGEAHSVMRGLVHNTKTSVLRMELVCRIRSLLLARKYLSTRPPTDALCLFDVDAGTVEISKFEISILKFLSRAPLSSQREIAKGVGCALVTVNHSLQRLKDSGVLKGAIYGVNFEKYGAQFFSVLVSMRHFDTETEKRIVMFASRAPHITHLVTTMGGWQVEFGVEVESLDELRSTLDLFGAEFSKSVAARRVVPRGVVHKFRPLPIE